MQAIPDEFMIIINRLKSLIDKTIIVTDKNDFDYDTAVFKFKVLAANPDWKPSSEVVITKIKELIGILYEKNYSLYSDVRSRTIKETSKEPIEIFEKEKIKLYFKASVEKKVNVEDEDRKAWYSKILPELRSYESLSQESIKKRECISEEKAKDIAGLNIKGVGFLIKQDGESINNFIRLLSDPLLLDYEISKMNIFIDVPLKTFALQLNKVFKEYQLPYSSPNKLIELNCFYYNNKGKETQIKKTNFASIISKIQQKSKA